MAKRSHAFELDLASAGAPKAARKALEAMGWEVLEEDRRHVVGEEPAEKLRCVLWPVTADITWTTASNSQTRFELECSVPGRGPIQNRQLDNRMQAVQRRIEEQASALVG
jgi:hypothetical protein